MKILISLIFLASISAAKSLEISIINNQGSNIGTAILKQASGGVLIEIKVKNLKAGKHGMHFHEVGSCDHSHKFMTAKGHIMPDNKPHGYLHPDGPHAGNLPNLIIGNDGTAHVELYSNLVSISGGDKPALLDSNGSALMIHENPDDHHTQPIGGSGNRVACGIIN